MSLEDRISLHVLVDYSPEDQAWFARCLDFDILGDGATPEEAVESLRGAVDAHIEFARDRGLPIFRRAPEDYWLMYYQAADRQLKKEPPGAHNVHAYALAV